MKIKIKAILLFLLVASLVKVKLVYYPSLSSVSLTGHQKVYEITSPDHKYKLNVYLYGGVLVKSDYSYIGELEEVTTSKKKNVLWFKPDLGEVRWIDHNTLLVDDKKINVEKNTYDFRWD
ncbi:DUF5412 family protein [Fredinandcohnia sp. 179-A 10B2 NHS]|uniref:DUF5412 family protein n=1 Tax=Fredinandcohnia sp. 179-A 10B2 NHS TaxID=3235176 RepID=UPI0039A0AECE